MVHKKRNVNYECLKCGRKFIRLVHIKQHIVIHVEKNKGFQCVECGKKFCRVNDLKKHKLIHNIHEKDLD